MELELDSIHISIIANGYIVRLDVEGEGDEWKTEKFYFSTTTKSTL